MAKFPMEDGSVVNTEKAKRTWKEDTNFNGRNHISVNTGSQWEHETLYLSAKNRYYIVNDSQWQGSLPDAVYISNEEAANWLIRNDHDLPEDLEKYEESIVE